MATNIESESVDETIGEGITVGGKEPMCGLIMPISKLGNYTETHWSRVQEIIKEAVDTTNFNCKLVSESRETRIIHGTIVENLYGNEIVVCDVSGKNPNVMFELGLRLAFDKPAIVIKDELTSYSFDTSPIEHLEYPSTLAYPEIVDFKKRLADKIVHTFEESKKADYSPFVGHFGRYKIVGLETEEVSKEEYLVQSINDLRMEVSRLSRRIPPKSFPPLDFAGRSNKGNEREILITIDGLGSRNAKEVADLLTAEFPNVEFLSVFPQEIKLLTGNNSKHFHREVITKLAEIDINVLSII